jgi:hypothetical protein
VSVKAGRLGVVYQDSLRTVDLSKSCYEKPQPGEKYDGPRGGS